MCPIIYLLALVWSIDSSEKNILFVFSFFLFFFLLAGSAHLSSLHLLASWWKQWDLNIQSESSLRKQLKVGCCFSVGSALRASLCHYMLDVKWEIGTSKIWFNARLTILKIKMLQGGLAFPPQFYLLGWKYTGFWIPLTWSCNLIFS